ncbi:MAG: hypothetical protein K6U14_07155 [Firmicutes bacterium]|nr:hypothetical protein [Alicyclobacillaceae bacterium]MCL6497396.1 hypothetical protein [Bacillota bacterium]
MLAAAAGAAWRYHTVQQASQVVRQATAVGHYHQAADELTAIQRQGWPPWTYLENSEQLQVQTLLQSEAAFQ